MQKLPKQPSQVRGNRIACINFQMCPVCYGCRAYDSRDADCLICEEEGRNAKRNFNVCNTNLHETWKVNKMITKNKVVLEGEHEFRGNRTIQDNE